MFDYNATAETALRLIDRFGMTVQFSKESTESVFDPVLGKHTSKGDPVVAEAKAVRVAAKRSVVEGDDNLMQELIRGRITGLLIAASGVSFRPEPNVKATLVDGSDWVVVAATPLNPAGTPIIYKALLKAS